MTKIISILLLSLSMGSWAFAEGGTRCKGDIEKFCKDVKQGGGRIIKCLKEHESQLSAECKARGEEMKEKMKEAHQACKADIDKFCKDVKPGEGRIIKCMQEHEKDLSADCKATHHSMKK